MKIIVEIYVPDECPLFGKNPKGIIGRKHSEITVCKHCGNFARQADHCHLNASIGGVVKIGEGAE